MTNAASTFHIEMILTPRFNMAATLQFLDPFRVANYLNGQANFRWQLMSVSGGAVEASNGLSLTTEQIGTIREAPDIAMVSSSWTPDAHFGPPLDGQLRRWARFGAILGGIDTGAFILAAAGLLDGYRATVHYEHIDGFGELFPKALLTEDLYVIDNKRITCCGGSAATDLSLQVVAQVAGPALANATARYIFHESLRPERARQLPEASEPLGQTVPPNLRQAIQMMENNLEDPVSIPQIAAEIHLSQRQMERLFHRFVRRSPQKYYSDIRLDRARSLVIQTEMAMREIALACGFASAEHFSRSYRARYGLAPRQDRLEGRVPFEFRAWPMHTEGARR